MPLTDMEQAFSVRRGECLTRDFSRSGGLWLVPDQYRTYETATSRVRVGGGWQIHDLLA